jgi:hypothetical protein
VSLCLSRSELRELSGYRQRSKVVHWLVKNGFRPKVGADGWPRVDRKLYERVMSGGMQRVGAEPNFDLVK